MTRFEKLKFGDRFWFIGDLLIKMPVSGDADENTFNRWNAFNPEDGNRFRIDEGQEVYREHEGAGEPEKQPTSGDLVDLVVGSWEAANVDVKGHVEAVRAAIGKAQKHIKHLPRSRNISCVVTKLDEARMWLNEHIAKIISECEAKKST